jgi:glycolate oxidase
MEVDFCTRAIGSGGVGRIQTQSFPGKITPGHALGRKNADERAVSAVAAAGVTPSPLELIDRHCLEAVDAWKNMGLSVDANVVLLGRTDAPGEQDATTLLDCFTAAGANWAAQSTDPEEADALFAARRLAYPALERLGPVLTEDVCVPIGQVAEMLERIERTAVRHDVTIANVAHAGEGNLHPLLITPVGRGGEEAGAGSVRGHHQRRPGPGWDGDR